MPPVSKIFKRILLPCAAGISNVDNSQLEPSCDKKQAPRTRPSDLPIYSKPCAECEDSKGTALPPSSIEETVGNIRKELWVWQDNLKGYRHKIVDVYRKGFSQADYVVDYLRQEAHGPQRLGAIGLSGLAGYILGMRRGMSRRILYGCTGALGMAAICYPNEALDYLESIVLGTRRYFIVVYHFIYGDPVEVFEEVVTEPKPKGRDCLCSPDPNDPKPCVLKCD